MVVHFTQKFKTIWAAAIRDRPGFFFFTLSPAPKQQIDQIISTDGRKTVSLDGNGKR
jgi:hypothetical protein